MPKKELTYAFVCFRELAYESNADQILETEMKIKRRLKYYSLGNYDPEKVNTLRALRAVRLQNLKPCLIKI